MHDSKQFGKKITTLIWCIITFLPLLIALIYFIGYHLTFNSGIDTASELTSYHTNGYNSFSLCLQNLTIFSFIPSWLKDSITSLLNAINISNVNVINLLSYAIIVQFIHFAFDLICWLFNIIHSLMEGVTNRI